MPILHIVAIARAVVNGTRAHEFGKKRLTINAIEIAMACPYNALRG